ncbi:Fe-S cluster assembly ATPase SufC [Candidatus Woesearchaeota archaeon]|nr:Fe-S cluster assembly ATPase SufC [Candidatus Woesearchaeota archaeon]
MKKLEIKDLHIEVNGTEIIKGVSLTFQSGKVHALMGPNGSGKSTLANALMGHPKYKITKGHIILDGKDITHEKPNIRANLGLFLSFQYPAEITGVTINNFLRTAVNNKREKKYSIVEFHNLLKEKMKELNIDISFIKRYINEGFSGGEKKKMEILQLSMLEPKYALLDETDSGMDVDAIRIVAEGINKVKQNKDMGIILITHYQRILDYLQPDEVSILFKGKIVATGGQELAKRIEKEGFEGVTK